jgi:septin family protein
MEFMKQLHDKVNIIPVIAKADTLTEEEIAYFKAQARHATHQQRKQSFPFYIFYKIDADVLGSVRSDTEPLKKK